MEDLGDRIGVTKQTISNLENHKKDSKMTLTQYLAIRSVLDYEAARRLEKNENDTLLLFAIRKVLDEDLSEDNLDETEDGIAFLASAVAGGTPSEKVQKLATEKLSMSTPDSLAGFALGAAVATTLAAVLGACIAGYMGKLFPSDEECEVPDDMEIPEPESDGIDT